MAPFLISDILSEPPFGELIFVLVHTEYCISQLCCELRYKNSRCVESVVSLHHRHEFWQGESILNVKLGNGSLMRLEIGPELESTIPAERLACSGGHSSECNVKGRQTIVRRERGE